MAVGERRVHAEAVHPVHDRQPELQDRHVDALSGREGLAQEVDDRHAGDLQRVLERQEDTGLAAHVGWPFGDLVATEPDRTAGDEVFGAAQQDRGQGRLSGTVGTHEGVDLAGVYHQVDPVEYPGAVGRRCVEVPYLKQRRSFGRYRVGNCRVGHGTSLGRCPDYHYGGRSNPGRPAGEPVVTSPGPPTRPGWDVRRRSWCPARVRASRWCRGRSGRRAACRWTR